MVPDFAVAIDGGWLVASNRGEFGGEVVFVGEDGTRQLVMLGPIDDILRLGDRWIVVDGIWHLTMNVGMLHALRRVDGAWLAEPWRRLPSSTKAQWLTTTGELLVQTSSGGTLLIAADGTMRMAPCQR